MDRLERKKYFEEKGRQKNDEMKKSEIPMDRLERKKYFEKKDRLKDDEMKKSKTPMDGLERKEYFEAKVEIFRKSQEILKELKKVSLSHGTASREVKLIAKECEDLDLYFENIIDLKCTKSDARKKMTLEELKAEKEKLLSIIEEQKNEHEPELSKDAYDVMCEDIDFVYDSFIREKELAIKIRHHLPENSEPIISEKEKEYIILKVNIRNPIDPSKRDPRLRNKTSSQKAGRSGIDSKVRFRDDGTRRG